MITREEALREFERFGATRDEAVQLLDAPEPKRMEIVKGIQDRLKKERKKELSWLPMPINEGPPLPRRFGIKWPWEK